MLRGEGVTEPRFSPENSSKLIMSTIVDNNGGRDASSQLGNSPSQNSEPTSRNASKDLQQKSQEPSANASRDVSVAPPLLVAMSARDRSIDGGNEKNGAEQQNGAPDAPKEVAQAALMNVSSGEYAVSLMKVEVAQVVALQSKPLDMQLSVDSSFCRY
jgi:hypothetical protein